MSNVVVNPYRHTQLSTFSQEYSGDGRQDGYTFESVEGWSYSGVAVQVGTANDESHNAYWWFENVDVPQGAVILDAKFTNRTRLSYGSPGRDLDFYWVGVKQTNPGYPVDYNDYYGRPLTDATVSDERHSPYAADVIEETPNLAAIFQEIVDQPTWQAGNNVLIYARFNSGFRWDWSSSTSHPRSLTIEYLT